MTVNSEQLASMYAQVLLGVPADQSRHVTDEESRASYLRMERQVAEIRAKDPNAVFEIQAEIP